MTTVNHAVLRRYFISATGTLVLSWSVVVGAHCDTLDGPVVTEARKALETGNINRVLGWVRQQDEAEVRDAFQRSVVVRKTGAAGKALADRYFFETVVRIHRAGEGAPYAGLKPAGEVEPVIAAADKSITTGNREPVDELIETQIKEGLRRRFEAVITKKRFDTDDVEAARAYVAAYVEYIHYVEGLNDAAGAGKSESADHASTATGKLMQHHH